MRLLLLSLTGLLISYSSHLILFAGKLCKMSVLWIVTLLAINVPFIDASGKELCYTGSARMGARKKSVLRIKLNYTARVSLSVSRNGRPELSELF